MENLNEIAQDFSDTLSIFQADNRDIAKQIPLKEALGVLIDDPDNIEGAFSVIRDWAESTWVPIILEQSTEAQKAAVKTAFKW